MRQHGAEPANRSVAEHLDRRATLAHGLCDLRTRLSGQLQLDHGALILGEARHSCKKLLARSTLQDAFLGSRAPVHRFSSCLEGKVRSLSLKDVDHDVARDPKEPGGKVSTLIRAHAGKRFQENLEV